MQERVFGGAGCMCLRLYKRMGIWAWLTGLPSSLVYSWAVCYVDDKHHNDGGRQPSASNAF